MREIAGIALVLAAVGIAPAGHFWSAIWWAVSVVFAIVGLLLFYSARTLRREKDRESGSSANAGGEAGYVPGPLSPGGLRSSSASSDDLGGDFDGD